MYEQNTQFVEKINSRFLGEQFSLVNSNSSASEQTGNQQKPKGALFA
jgi:hypothetical protein